MGKAEATGVGLLTDAAGAVGAGTPAPESRMPGGKGNVEEGVLVCGDEFIDFTEEP